MPGYSPLPNVELDPRNEAELVQAAARRVYEASNATINDFSSGSPIVALLEGQAFAQAEFLQFANQFPESVLVEWIGPFLGAQRRTGAGAIVDISFVIKPRDDQFDVFPGYQIGTDPNKTGGEQIVFVTTERLTIPSGQSKGQVKAISVLRGVGANVAPGTITKSLTSLSGVESVLNTDAATGGQDPELLSEVKERFFSLIRRRNPVSAEDWQDFFSDALGPGTACTVLPRRSEKDTYRYGLDYEVSAPAVSFFVLNPDGTPITSAQKGALENLMRWSLPVEFLGQVYPMEVNDVDFHIGLDYDPSKPYAQDLTRLTQTARNSMFAVMQPNAVFPVSYDQSVSDVESALATSFPLTLGTTNQYIDPDIGFMKAYVPPTQIGISGFNLTSPVPFKSGDAIQKGDLVVEQGNTFAVYYEALESFTPQLSDKTYFVNTGDLDVELIRTLSVGSYDTGDVIETDGKLYVVLTAFSYRSVLTIADLISRGFISREKVFADWEEGASYTALDSNGNYDPQIIQYDQDDTRFNVFFPSTPSYLNKHKRPGSPVYVVNTAFTVTANTTTLGTAQASGLVSTTTSVVRLLKEGETYLAGEYVKTPDPSELQTGQINQENCYIDQVAGATEVFGRVLETFTFVQTGTLKAAVTSLVEGSALEIIRPVPFIGCDGKSSFSSRPFRYKARFSAGEYVRYRPIGGYDAAELETCIETQGKCAEVSETCRKLFLRNLDTPRYFFALKDFTPNTSDIASLVEQEVIEEVTKSFFESTYTAYVPSTETVYSNSITSSLINAGDIPAESSLILGDTALVIGDNAESRGLYEWTGSIWVIQAPGLPTFRDLFRFAPGDVVSFRSTSAIRNYAAVEHVTPIMSIETYFDNGVFIRSEASQTVPWIDPNYAVEDVIYDLSNGATTFYRVIKSFTPPVTRTVWNGSVVVSTPRIEEIFTNVIKFVNLVTCSESITSRIRDGASTTKLGTCQIDVKSKSMSSVSNTFVWESTSYAAQGSALSAFPNSNFAYGPVNYGDGTLAL
tara:strand:+ start:8579 stop:11641 length:3063 start_codon:yes stop_codon:yes gene_type:complete